MPLLSDEIAEQVKQELADLATACTGRKVESILHLLHRIVPEFHERNRLQFLKPDLVENKVKPLH